MNGVPNEIRSARQELGVVYRSILHLNQIYPNSVIIYIKKNLTQALNYETETALF